MVSIMRYSFRIFLILLALVGATFGATLGATPGATVADDVAAAAAGNDTTGARWAERILKKMSLEEKVGQLFMVWA